jgi:CMP-N-acetylneuraminic acid synthetase
MNQNIHKNLITFHGNKFIWSNINMFKNCEEIDIISTQLIGNIHNQKIEKYKDA